MTHKGLQDYSAAQLAALTSVLGTARIPVYEAGNTEPKLITVDELLASTGGLLDNNNTFTGNNDFTGDFSLDGTAVTATAEELNKLDDSLQTEDITVAGAIAIDKTNTNLDATAGTFAATLDVCPIDMIGKIKTIRMEVDNGDVTLALTNIQGGTAATTATFANVGEELILIGSAGGKWTVVKEFGVTLS